MASLQNFNLNPGPQGGYGAYGGVPGPLDLPPSLYSQTGTNIPQSAGTAGKTADFINSELAGQIAPESMNLLQQKAADMGAAGGQPMTGGQGTFSGNNFLQSLGLDQQNLMHQGAMDYLQFAPTIGNLQTDPNLAFTVAQQNALNAAAPNPQQAASQLQTNYNQGRGATSGGGWSFSPQSPSGPTYGVQYAGTGGGGNPPIAYGPSWGTPVTNGQAWNNASPYANYNDTGYGGYDPQQQDFMNSMSGYYDNYGAEPSLSTGPGANPGNYNNPPDNSGDYASYTDFYGF